MTDYLVDTCIIIDFLRKKDQAAQFLRGLENPPFLSALTVAELYTGVREGKERELLDNLVQRFPVIPIDDEVAIKGGLYRRIYGKSHGVGIIDALLAGTSDCHNLAVATTNVKHFPMLEKVYCPY
jgi:hypothetical protein